MKKLLIGLILLATGCSTSLQVLTDERQTSTKITTSQERLEYIKDQNGITIKLNGQIINETPVSDKISSETENEENVSQHEGKTQWQNF